MVVLFLCNIPFKSIKKMKPFPCLQLNSDFKYGVAYDFPSVDCETIESSFIIMRYICYQPITLLFILESAFVVRMLKANLTP